MPLVNIDSDNVGKSNNGKSSSDSDQDDNSNILFFSWASNKKKVKMW